MNKIKEQRRRMFKMRIPVKEQSNQATQQE
jgi:hypothetical protein